MSIRKERELPLSARAKFLEVFSDACEAGSIPYPDRNYLFQEIDLMSDPDLLVLIQLIDDSPHQIIEWLKSLVLFQIWLRDHHLGKNFPDQIEYISCCIQGTNSVGLLTLPDLLKSFLDNYGVE